MACLLDCAYCQMICGLPGHLHKAWRQIRLFLTAFFKKVTAKLALLAVAFNWGENMTAKRFVLAATGLKMTAKLTDFAVNYKISESGNLTNNDFFNLLMRWNRKRRIKTVLAFSGHPSFRFACRLSFNFRFVTEDKFISAVYRVSRLHWGGPEGALRPWPYCSNLKCSYLKMLRPKYALIIRQSKPFVNLTFCPVQKSVRGKWYICSIVHNC